MKSSLNTIRKLTKVARVLSQIIFILCLIGAIACAAGVVCVALGLTGTFSFAGVTLNSFIENESGLSSVAVYASLAVSFIMVMGELIVSKTAERTFRHELDAGTPFTFRGADEMKRLGILSIVVPLVTTFIASIVHAVMQVVMGGIDDLEISGTVSIGLGIAFLIVSVLFRYGAEREQERFNSEE